VKDGYTVMGAEVGDQLPGHVRGDHGTEPDGAWDHLGGDYRWIWGFGLDELRLHCRLHCRTAFLLLCLSLFQVVAVWLAGWPLSVVVLTMGSRSRWPVWSWRSSMALAAPSRHISTGAPLACQRSSRAMASQP